MGQGRQALLLVSRSEFRELNELATRQHTQSAHRRLLKMKWLALPGGVDPNDLVLQAAPVPHAGGRRSMTTSLISRLGFSRMEQPGCGQLTHQRGNHCCGDVKTLIARQ